METVTTKNEPQHSRKRTTTYNGVDVTALMETIRAIQDRPELANFTFRTRNRWSGASRNRTEIKNYYGTCQEITNRTEPFVLRADEPPVLLGTDEGPNPTEYLLTALSACMTTTLAYMAAAEGINLETIESQSEGDIDLHGFLGLDPKVRRGFGNIRMKFRVKGDAGVEKIQELLQKSPVYDSLVHPVPVKVSVEKI